MDPITPGNAIAKIDNAQQLQQQINRDGVIATQQAVNEEKKTVEAKAKTVSETEKSELEAIRPDEGKARRRERRRKKREERAKEEKKKQAEELIRHRHNFDVLA